MVGATYSGPFLILFAAPRTVGNGKSLVTASGRMALTVMPCCFRFADRVAVSPIMAALAAGYAILRLIPGKNMKEAEEEILMILPYFCLIISLTAAWLQLKCPLT